MVLALNPTRVMVSNVIQIPIPASISPRFVTMAIYVPWISAFFLKVVNSLQLFAMMAITVPLILAMVLRDVSLHPIHAMITIHVPLILALLDTAFILQ
jgi:hypothetical protein